MGLGGKGVGGKDQEALVALVPQVRDLVSLVRFLTDPANADFLARIEAASAELLGRIETVGKVEEIEALRLVVAKDRATAAAELEEARVKRQQVLDSASAEIASGWSALRDENLKVRKAEAALSTQTAKDQAAMVEAKGQIEALRSELEDGLRLLKADRAALEAERAEFDKKAADLDGTLKRLRGGA